MSDLGMGLPLEELRELIAARALGAIHQHLSGYHPSDLADLLEELEEDERRQVLVALAPTPALAAEALAEMEWEEHPEESLAALAPTEIAHLVAQLSDDDAADIIGELEPADQERVLAALPHLDAGDIRDLLSYDEESAGGLMTTELVAVDERLTAAEAIEEVRRQAQEVGEFYSVFVIDPDRRLCGTLPLQSLVTAAPGQRIRDLVEPIVVSVAADTDQEEVGRLLSRYNLVAVPVVDAAGRLLGRITFDDVIDVIEAETTEDILRFAGTSDEEELRGDWQGAVRSRFPWLVINLATAFAAAAVYKPFSDAIGAIPMLAGAATVVAGMGGNGATQTLAVTVRRLALNHGAVRDRPGIVAKEILVGLVNGAGNGLIAGATVALFGELLHYPPALGVIVTLAMLGNLVIAGFAGSLVPIAMEKFGVDPAIASTVIVTTFTDMGGFFLTLYLATALLL
ncbi:MAG TPA: magnesium transporter [Longimicrobiaceae bacterium]|nr:magnesium transporter [Longimicrobiaceae bacterium]